MKCSVFIATSLDGYIATKEGDVDWLDHAGDTSIDLGEEVDMGFHAFMKTVDCLIMGRRCMEKIASFNLTDEQWPYGKTRVIALSNQVKQVPDNLKGKVELESGSIHELLKKLEKQGHESAYVDGGALISSFLDAGLIEKLVITVAPVILGEGIPLFQGLKSPIRLSKPTIHVFDNGFIQKSYVVAK